MKSLCVFSFGRKWIGGKEKYKPFFGDPVDPHGLHIRLLDSALPTHYKHMHVGWADRLVSFTG